MVFTKLRIALVATLVVTVAVLSAAALARQEGKDGPVPDVKTVEASSPVPVATPLPRDPVQRTVRGIVRDDQGRPLGKARVGSAPRPLLDTWDNPLPGDIRERQEPFRDAKGNTIPPGPVGKYFEVRNRRGEWHPVSPDDINLRPAANRSITVFGDGHAVPSEEVDKNRSAYIVRAAKGGWWMDGLPGVQNAVRTDADGRFSATLSLDSLSQAKLHFASADYTLQAIHVVKAEAIDTPLEVSLKPTRLVSARVIEVPQDDPNAYLNWTAYTADATGKAVQAWQHRMVPEANANEADRTKRRLEIRLPAGRYKIEFRSETLRQAVDVEVPPGAGPLDLPDIRLESLASVRMVGKPAAATAPTRRSSGPPRPHVNVKVKGKVVGPNGQPLAGAKLAPQLVVVRDKEITTGPEGEFEFTAERILIDHFTMRVEAPDLASKIFTIPATGEVPTPLKLGVGTVVSGRVIRDGKPQAGVAMRLVQVQWGSDDYLGTLEAETDGQGRFRFPHAFADQELYAYTKTGQLKDHGAITPYRFKTGGEGRAVDLGDFAVQPGRRLAGRVVFADGKAIPAETRVLASPMNRFGLLYSRVDERGRFEFLGLPEWEISVSVQFPNSETWMLPGYRLSARNKCASPVNHWELVGQLDRDVTDLTILFEPGEEPRPNSSDPDLWEQLKEIKAATIAGVPPDTVPPR